MVLELSVKDIGQSSFTVKGPQIWNTLQPEIEKTKTNKLTVFKKFNAKAKIMA